MFQRVHPRIKTNDLCQTSLDLLHGALSVFFEKRQESFWFVDHESSALEQASHAFRKGEKNINVVLAGSFLLRLCELPYWPMENVRLWFFCERTALVAKNLLGIPDSFINVIPRTELEFPPILIKSISSSSNDHWYYAGRLSPGKNILGLLLTSLALQKLNPKHQLTLYGAYDEESDASWGRYILDEHENKLKSVLNSNEWISPPRLKNWSSPQVWLSDASSGRVVSFSTHMSEDFSTMAFWAAQNHIPLLLSDWGGHADQIQAKLIPSAEIPQSYEPLGLIKFKANALALKIHQGYSFVECVSQRNSFSQSDAWLKVSELQSIIAKWMRSMGASGFHILRGNLDRFADTQVGRDFFYQYRLEMAGLKSINKLGLYHPSFKDLSRVESKSSDCVWISMEKMTTQAGWKEVLSQKKVYVHSDDVQAQNILARVQQKFGGILFEVL